MFNDITGEVVMDKDILKYIGYKLYNFKKFFLYRTIPRHNPTLCLLAITAIAQNTLLKRSMILILNCATKTMSLQHMITLDFHLPFFLHNF